MCACVCVSVYVCVAVTIAFMVGGWCFWLVSASNECCSRVTNIIVDNPKNNTLPFKNVLVHGRVKFLTFRPKPAQNGSLALPKN